MKQIFSAPNEMEFPRGRKAVMPRFAGAVITAAALGTVALGSATVAAAMPSGSGNAADTVNTLQSQGYHVQINGPSGAPLARCRTIDVHAPGQHQAGDFNTAYVTVSCPND
jgi:hypothetical protein